MAGKAVYKNSLKSQSLIKKALLELMAEKDLNKISISDIVKRAGINRGTFYAHYRDVQNVLAEIENELIDELSDRIDECNEKDLINNPLPILREIDREIEEHIDFLRLLMKTGISSRFLEKLKNQFIERMMNDPRTKARYSNRAKFRTTMSFFAGGMAALYQDWFDGKIDMTLDETAETVCANNPCLALPAELS
jgi:AcrR family transcriptional regulator